ncbi:MAG: YtxH domain-containing protein [Dehalobacterium sp.]
MNRSFFRGILAGSIMGTLIGMFSAPQMKPIPESTRNMMNNTIKMQNRAKKVLKGITKGVSDIIK